MNIEQKLEEFDEILGSPKCYEMFMGETCPICGQPCDKSQQVIALKSFLRQALEQVRKETIEECERAVPKEKTWGGYDGEGIVDDKEAYGFNVCRSETLANLNKLKS